MKRDARENRNGKVFLFAGGGTGGHLYPALAIADKIKETRPSAEIHFVGTARGIEARVIPETGYPIHYISVRGVRRALTLRNLWVPFSLLKSLIQSAAIVSKIKPDVVIGTGGYVSGPILFVAHFLGYRTLVQEQNSYPGVTTRLLARIADRVHISFEESEKYFKHKEKLRLTGNPVRDFLPLQDKKEARRKFQLDPNRPTVLIFGGSQGALSINRVVAEALDRILRDSGAQIIWSTGKTGYTMASEKATQYQGRLWVSEFISDMAAAYAASDVVVARAGAISLAEITNCGLPSILIPYPYAAGDHQMTNARALQALGAAVVIPEKELNADVLAEALLGLLADEERRKRMAEAAKKAAFPDAAERIVQSIFDLIN